MKQISAVFLIFFVCSASANFWRQCHTGSPLPTSVSSPACNESDCEITRGGTLTGTVIFTPTDAHQTIELHVRYQAGPNLWIPVPVTEPNACLVMTPGCPTAAGTPQTLNLNLPIPDDLPQASGVNFELYLVAIAPIPADVVCWQQSVYVY